MKYIMFNSNFQGFKFCQNFQFEEGLSKLFPKMKSFHKVKLRFLFSEKIDFLESLRFVSFFEKNFGQKDYIISSSQAGKKINSFEIKHHFSFMSSNPSRDTVFQTFSFFSCHRLILYKSQQKS